MVQPFSAINICERFVFEVLTEDPDVMAELDDDTDRVRPRYGPPDLASRHVVHTFAGPDGGEPAVPFGHGIAQLGLFWDVTMWEPGASLAALEPLAKAVMGALAGPQVFGRKYLQEHGDGSVWSITVWYAGPQVVPPDIGPPEWNRLSDRYRLELRPVSA